MPIRTPTCDLLGIVRLIVREAEAVIGTIGGLCTQELGI